MAAYLPARGGRGEGSTLGAAFFGYKNKKTTPRWRSLLYAIGVFSSPTQKAEVIISLRIEPIENSIQSWLLSRSKTDLKSRLLKTKFT
jgi:hypothetical protein